MHGLHSSSECGKRRCCNAATGLEVLSRDWWALCNANMRPLNYNRQAGVGAPEPGMSNNTVFGCSTPAYH